MSCFWLVPETQVTDFQFLARHSRKKMCSDVLQWLWNQIAPIRGVVFSKPQTNRKYRRNVQFQVSCFSPIVNLIFTFS